MRTRARGGYCLAADALGAECAQSAHFFIRTCARGKMSLTRPRPARSAHAIKIAKAHTFRFKRFGKCVLSAADLHKSVHFF